MCCQLLESIIKTKKYEHEAQLLSAKCYARLGKHKNNMQLLKMAINKFKVCETLYHVIVMVSKEFLKFAEVSPRLKYSAYFNLAKAYWWAAMLCKEQNGKKKYRIWS